MNMHASSYLVVRLYIKTNPIVPEFGTDVTVRAGGMRMQAVIHDRYITQSLACI